MMKNTSAIEDPTLSYEVQQVKIKQGHFIQSLGGGGGGGGKRSAGESCCRVDQRV